MTILDLMEKIENCKSVPEAFVVLVEEMQVMENRIKVLENQIEKEQIKDFERC